MDIWALTAVSQASLSSTISWSLLRFMSTESAMQSKVLDLQLQFSSVQLLSHVLLFATPWIAAHHASLSITNSWSLLKLVSIESVMPSHPLSSPSPPALNLSQHQGLFQWVSSSHQVAKVLELQLQHQSFQWVFRTDFLEDWLVWSPWIPRHSQESSPTPQFKRIKSSMLNLLYGSALTSRHDYWKNHSFD